MRLSIAVTDFSWPSGPAGLATELGRLARRADEGGLDTLWVPDHLLQGAPGTTPEQEMPEAYTTLGYLAAVTTGIRLGTAVSAVTFRPPTLLIKAVTALDVLSGGRAWLGVGAGYHRAEAEMMDLPLPPTGQRFEHLEDTLRLALQMWAGDDAPFDGVHHRPTRPLNSPQTLTRPHPPILIGGTGERRTLRLVAQYADACNVFDIPDGGATIRHKLDVLAGHCDSVGRRFDEIEKTVSTRIVPGEAPEAFADRCAALGALGLDHVVVLTAGPWTEDALDRVVAAAPTVHDLAPGPVQREGGPRV